MAAGLCVYGTVTWAYSALLPVLLYAAFLHDFLHPGAPQYLDQELLYYSEMLDAGVLDGDVDDEGEAPYRDGGPVG